VLSQQHHQFALSSDFITCQVFLCSFMLPQNCFLAWELLMLAEELPISPTLGGALFGFLLILYWRKYGSRL